MHTNKQTNRCSIRQTACICWKPHTPSSITISHTPTHTAHIQTLGSFIISTSSVFGIQPGVKTEGVMGCVCAEGGQTNRNQTRSEWMRKRRKSQQARERDLRYEEMYEVILSCLVLLKCYCTLVLCLSFFMC